MSTRKHGRDGATRKHGKDGKKAKAAALTAAPGELVVRMYRQGLGDCFLLALPAAGGKTRYLLIDCGVHARQDNGPRRLQQVLDNLVSATGSHLDVVVATHEHADHLSGFVQKGSPFLRDQLTVSELWVAWTEKRGDGQADALRRKRGTARAVIDKAVKEARDRAGNTGPALADNLKSLIDFETPAAGAVDDQAVLAQIARLGGATSETTSVEATFLGMAKTGKKARPSSNELALRLLVLKAGDARVSYCEPGETRLLDGVDGFRAYVLGPPRTDLLDKDKPSKIRGATEESEGGAYKEVYLTASSANRALELSPRFGLDATADGGVLPEAWRHPFMMSTSRMWEHSAPAGVGKHKRWIDETVPAATRDFVDTRYCDPRHDWRRIDGEWLGAAETLALNLVGDTNNTSLVLAVEWGTPGAGHILLFAADAQVGNWLSWRDQDYGTRKKFSADELMERVVLYKVGHHGSHNATVRRDSRKPSDTDPLGTRFGLELMKDIIAMIPVDWSAAQKKMPDPWKMPHEPLYRRLREKARRRVLRSDEKLNPLHTKDDEPDLVPTSENWTPVTGLRGVRWRRAKETFAGTTSPLYYDVAFKQAKGRA